MGRLIKFAKPYFWQSILCPFLMVGEVVMELLIPLYMSKSSTSAFKTAICTMCF